MPSPEDLIKTALRLPRPLHASLIEAAARNGRSLNAEIVARLSINETDLKLTELASKTASIQSMTKEILEAVQRGT